MKTAQAPPDGGSHLEGLVGCCPSLGFLRNQLSKSVSFPLSSSLFFRRSFLPGNSSSCSRCGGVFRLNRLIPVSRNARRECNQHSPRTSLGRDTLPWALTTINQTAAAMPESDARESVCACAKGVDVSLSPDDGTSGIARIPLANAKFAAGRRHVARRIGGGMWPRKPSTPQRSGRAAVKLN